MKTDESPDLEISLRRFRDDLRGDLELRARVLAEPAGVLEEQGLSLPPETDVRVVEDTAEVRHFVLPHAPNASLSDAAMDAVSGGLRLEERPGALDNLRRALELFGVS